MKPRLKFRNPVLHVEVTDKDWDDASVLLKGGQPRWRCCPNALACTRALKTKFRRHPEIRMVVTGSSITLFEKDTYYADFLVPNEAVDVIIAFDGAGGRRVKTSYDLDLSKAIG